MLLGLRTFRAYAHKSEAAVGYPYQSGPWLAAQRPRDATTGQNIGGGGLCTQEPLSTKRIQPDQVTAEEGGTCPGSKWHVEGAQ